MATQQTEKMSLELPQFAAAFHNADVQSAWNVRMSYAAKREDISLKNSPIALKKENSPIEFKTRTSALIASANAARKSATNGGIIAKEGHAGGYGCWRTCDANKRACWLFVYPAPKAAAADISTKPAEKPAEQPQPKKRNNGRAAAQQPQESASAARRRIAAEQAAQKIAADTAAAAAEQQPAAAEQPAA